MRLATLRCRPPGKHSRKNPQTHGGTRLTYPRNQLASKNLRNIPANRASQKSGQSKFLSAEVSATKGFAKAGKPRIAQKLREDHYTPEKSRMECVGKTCCAATESATCRKKFASLLNRAALNFAVLKLVLWSWRRDLNPRPPDYKSGALPTELRQQIPGNAAPSRKRIPLIPSRCPGQLFKVSQGQFWLQQKLGHRVCPRGHLAKRPLRSAFLLRLGDPCEISRRVLPL